MPEILVPATLQNCCLTLGNFDGVHRGHLQIVRAARLLADQLHIPAVAATFSPHPLELLRPLNAPPAITSLEERCRLLLQAGVDHVFVLPVTARLLQMSAHHFFDSVLVGSFAARAIVEGPNFHFGRGREGNTALLRTLCQSAAMQFVEVAPLDDAAGMFSSSRIRELLAAGQLTEAVTQLGHPLRVTGIVTQGAQRGRTLGFPTANLSDVSGMLPANGVYAGFTQLAGKRITAAVSIGPNPTFGEQMQKVECHLVDFQGDLYGQQLAIDLIADLRPLRPFHSVEELRSQITADIATAVHCVETL